LSAIEQSVKETHNFMGVPLIPQQAGAVAHSISPNPSGHGPLINLGEYNPCTLELCAASQASKLLAGQAYPLNGQDFIHYSGLWGSPGLVKDGPRGPVFQGFDGDWQKYTSWYNQGSDEPLFPTLVLNQEDKIPMWLLKGDNFAGFIDTEMCDDLFAYVISGAATIPGSLYLYVCPGTNIKFEAQASLTGFGRTVVDGSSVPITIFADLGDLKRIKVSGKIIMENGGQVKIY
jgi:hypothetical protein